MTDNISDANAGPRRRKSNSGSLLAAKARHGCVEWIRDHAFAIDPTQPPTPAALSTLDAVLGNPRIALLVTTTPSVAQRDAFHACLLTYLLARDFSLIAVARGWASGERINRYLAGADAPEFPSQASPQLPDDDTARLARFLARNAAAQRTNLGVFGYDIEGEPAAVRSELIALIDQVPTNTLLTNLRNLLQHTARQTPVEEVEQVNWASDWLDMQFAPLTDQLGGDRYQRLVHGVGALHDSLGYQRLRALPATRADAALLRRDRVMSNVAHALSQRYPERRAVLLCNADDASPHVFARHTLAAGQAFSVWLLHGGSRNTSGLNALLAEVGGTFVLPLADLSDPRAAPLRDSMVVTPAGNSQRRWQIAGEADVIYFAPDLGAD